VLNKQGDGAFEVATVEDQDPVEALSSSGANPALGERVGTRSPYRGAHDAHALGPEHGVEAGDELGVTVAHEELEGLGLLAQRADEVAGLLGDPRTCGVGGDTGQPHSATVELDEEQHVNSLHCDGVDGQEVAGQGAGSLGSEELHPGGAVASRGGTEPMPAQDVADRGGRNDDAELCQLALDSQVTPTGILSC
jgi:hypothetical protein